MKRINWLLSVGLFLTLSACASPQKTLLPVATELPDLASPASATSILPASTPEPTAAIAIHSSTASPRPHVSATEPWTPTPLPASLEAFGFSYNPDASLELPPRGSISMLFWGGEVPVEPLDSTPEFIPFPTPQGMEHSADELSGFGCELDYWGWATCPADNPLQRFGCDHLVAPRRIGHDPDREVSLVAICKKETEEHEAAKINGLYLSGCAFKTENSYIFKINGEYALVSSLDELKLLFSPIDSPQEAVSYAQLVTGLDAIYDFDYDPALMYFHETITATKAIETGGAFNVNLFKMDGCGCEPWFNTQISIRVDRAGQVTWGDAVPIFMTTGWSCAD